MPEMDFSTGKGGSTRTIKDAPREQEVTIENGPEEAAKTDNMKV
jgi:hypothetical protein